MCQCKALLMMITCAYLTIASSPGAYSRPANFAGPTTARLSLADWESYNLRDIDGNPGTYAFGYDVDDPETGNTQYRDEQRYPNGTVIGSYGYVDARGDPVQVRYIADEKGYRIITNNNHKKNWNSNYENTNSNRIHPHMMNQREPSTQTPPYNHHPGMKSNPQYNNHKNPYKINALPIIYTQMKSQNVNPGYDISRMSQFGEGGSFNIAMKHRIEKPIFKNPGNRRNNIFNNVLYTPSYNVPAK